MAMQSHYQQAELGKPWHMTAPRNWSKLSRGIPALDNSFTRPIV